jgi:hypothetical protein
MGFVCENEIALKGGTETDRKKSAEILSALDIVDEGTLVREEKPSVLVLRFASVDGLPEEEAMGLAAEFPGLGVSLVYFSKDGEFFGFSRSGPDGDAAESADLEPKDLDEVGMKHDGDGIAFVKERFGLNS